MNATMHSHGHAHGDVVLERNLLDAILAEIPEPQVDFARLDMLAATRRHTVELRERTARRRMVEANKRRTAELRRRHADGEFHWQMGDLRWRRLNAAGYDHDKLMVTELELQERRRDEEERQQWEARASQQMVERCGRCGSWKVFPCEPTNELRKATKSDW